MKAKYAQQGLVVLTIHTPEFDWERQRSTVLETAQRFHIENPIYLDNDSAYWNALGNRYWPSFYLVSRQGRVVYNAIGEMHEGDGDARQLEQALQRLLAQG